MNSEGESFGSNNGLIPNKRKKKNQPTYNSIGTDYHKSNLTYVKSLRTSSPYHNQVEDLRDFHYDYLWKVSVGGFSVRCLWKVGVRSIRELCPCLHKLLEIPINHKKVSPSTYIVIEKSW